MFTLDNLRDHWQDSRPSPFCGGPTWVPTFNNSQKREKGEIQQEEIKLAVMLEDLFFLTESQITLLSGFKKSQIQQLCRYGLLAQHLITNGRKKLPFYGVGSLAVELLGLSAYTKHTPREIARTLACNQLFLRINLLGTFKYELQPKQIVCGKISGVTGDTKIKMTIACLREWDVDYGDLETTDEPLVIIVPSKKRLLETVDKYQLKNARYIIDRSIISGKLSEAFWSVQDGKVMPISVKIFAY